MTATPSPSPSPSSPTNVLVVGVGGQGVIMVSKVLAHVCQRQGLRVKQSEVHGMAKRGGTVFSHIRFGEEVWSPVIPEGEADVLMALEWAEGIRWLPFLRPHSGTFIADTQRIVPPFACRDRRPGGLPGYARETPAEILEWVKDGCAVDAAGMARELGNLRVANSLLLGILSTVVDFPEDDWLSSLSAFVPEKTEDLNRAAFLQGRHWTESAPAPSPLPEGLSRPEPAEPPEIELEIVAEWCKGCDICVKMCPERCLALDEVGIVELTEPDACTGCRICEMLCPDFAIAVHIG